MSLQVIIKAFRDAEAASVVIKNFNYGKAWDFNGVPSREYPAILVDSQPDWSVKRQGSNGLPSIKEYTFKTFIYDEYWRGEQTANNNELEIKQDEVESLFDDFLSLVSASLLSKGYQVYTQGKEGFHGLFTTQGDGRHNSSLITVFQKLRIVAPANCP